MNSFLVFTAKELKEQVKTFKGVVVFIVLLIFGTTSPLLAKLTPELMKMAGSSGIEIKMPAPTFLDAYAQFFKNISQMVLLIVILVFSNSVAAETSKGTAGMMLTKRLSRSGFVLAKFTSGALLWTVSYAAAAALTLLYTVYLFPSGKPVNLLLAFACMWLFGVLILAVSIFCSTLFKNYALAAVGGFLIWGLLCFSSSVSKIKDCTPSALQTINTGIIGGSVSAGKAFVPGFAGVLLTALFLACACAYLNRREL